MDNLTPLERQLVDALRPFAHFACSPPGQCKCNNCRARDLVTAAQSSSQSPSKEGGAVPGWQPIAIAPKDGTIIRLGFLEDGEITQTAEMQWAHIQRNGFFPGKVGLWTCPGGNFTWNDEPAEFGPSHWQPIAARPLPADGGAA